MTTLRRDGDEGQITLPLVAVVLALFAVAIGVTAFGEASDRRGGAQKGTDAAALGAAVAARDAAILLVPTPAGFAALESGAEELVLAGQPQAVGCAAAYGWAAENRDAVTECEYQGGGRIHTKTATRPSDPRGLVGEAEATADMNLPTCVMVRVETQAGETETVTCTGRGGVGTVVYQNGIFVSMSPKQSWQSAFHVRLVE
ncbi:hypothetical protein GCM10027446_08290 [Angustibacter peucedani]